MNKKDKELPINLGLLWHYSQKVGNSYKVLVTTPFGVLIGTPIFDTNLKLTETDKNFTISEACNNNQLLLQSYTDFIEEELQRRKKEISNGNKAIALLPLFESMGYFDAIAFKNVTLHSQGFTFELPSFTLFPEHILGISFYP